jgi:hypothetical protein
VRDRSSHNWHIFAQMEKEGCSLFPRSPEGKESYLGKVLSSPPSYPFTTCYKIFSPRVTSSRRHGESDTCQTEAQTVS